MPRRDPLLAFEAIRIEGALLSADFLAKVADAGAGGQTPERYRLRHGLTLRDEIGQAWRVAAAHHRDLAATGLNRAQRESILRAMLREAFGWESISTDGTLRTIGERSFPLSATGVGGAVPIVFGDGDAGLDEATNHHGDEHRRRSPFGLLQEYLNAAPGSLWGVVTNGLQLRIVRDNESLTRPAWIEADLSRIFHEERYADFSLLWLLLHESRFGAPGEAPHEAPLEQWCTASMAQGSAARDRLRGGVEQALLALGRGFLAHPDNAALRGALTSGALDAAAYQRELLRLVYRLIVLLVAEERDLLHPPDSDAEARKWYAEGYALRRLRERAGMRRSYDRHDDLWDGVRVVFRGCATGEPRLALPALGGLYGADQCAHLDAASLGNAALLEAVFHLTWLREDAALVRVNWRDMGTEELGSVYESLLELQADVGDEARTFAFQGRGDGAAGHARRLTGSYYTPDSLVQALLDSALDPVIARALGQSDPQAALLALSVIDPAMGSGHFLLGAARRIAGQLARLRTDGTPGPEAYRRALREVISHCLYGVDKNAMAVELARIALWLEAMEPGKPLAFLDHHLVHGDALLGILDPAVLEEGIPDEAFAALSGDDKETAKQLKAANKADVKALAKERKAGQFVLRFDRGTMAEQQQMLDAMPDDTLEAVVAKRAALEQHEAARAGAFRLACDAYVAAFLLPKTSASRLAVPTTGTLRNLAVGAEPTATMRTGVEEMAAAVPFLHWPITFAAVMARGGFDCVLGNPPWEKLAFSDEEFFRNRDAGIADAAGDERVRMIAALAEAPPGSRERRLHQEYFDAKQLLNASSGYVRKGGRFPLTGQGIVNLYALFTELALGLRRSDGLAGMVVPSGIASDAGTAEFFRHVADGRLVSLIDFENREALFAGVHRSYKFCLLTLGASREPLFTFFLTRPEQRFDERRRFTLTPEDLRRLNPNTGTAPIFRSKADAELTAKIYRNVPVLWDETREDGNPWGIQFRQGLFNMTSDSGLFEREPLPGYVPLYEAKMIHQYDHRWATYTGEGEDEVRPVTAEEKADPDFRVRPRYWVPQEEVEARLRAKGWDRPWLLGWRDIARATDERTVIASVMPRVGMGDPVLLMFPGGEHQAIDALLLLGDQSSLVHDYVARQKVGGTHLKFHTKRQIATLTPYHYTNGIRELLLPRICRLIGSSSELSGLREDVAAGWTRRLEWSHAESITRAGIRAEVDALYASLYGLNRDDLRFVLDPSDVVGAEYPSETFRVLKDNELRQFGEYRTRRLVLEAWDRLIGTR